MVLSPFIIVPRFRGFQIFVNCIRGSIPITPMGLYFSLHSILLSYHPFGLVVYRPHTRKFNIQHLKLPMN